MVWGSGFFLHTNILKINSFSEFSFNESAKGFINGNFPVAK